MCVIKRGELRSCKCQVEGLDRSLDTSLCTCSLLCTSLDVKTALHACRAAVLPYFTAYVHIVVMTTSMLMYMEGLGCQEDSTGSEGKLVEAKGLP